MLDIRAALGPIDDELLRLQRRLSGPESTNSALKRARLRYADVRTQLDSVDAEIRWAVDAARGQVEAAHLERQKSLERLVGRLGMALVIAALIPSLFTDTVKLPAPDRFMDFVGMLLLMFGLAGIVLCGLPRKLKDAIAGRARHRLSMGAASHVLAVGVFGVGVGLLMHVSV
jgi:hypothetical protein